MTATLFQTGGPVPIAPPRKSTPWGRPDQATKYADGVVQYFTPGHGGFHLDPDRNAEVHEVWRRTGGWYEEDCEWAIVAYTFPDLFDDDTLEAARSSLRNWEPHAWVTVTGERLDPGDSIGLTDEIFDAENASRLVTVAAWGQWHEDVPDGMVGVLATVGGVRGVDGFGFLIPKVDYQAQGSRHVIDTGAVPWPECPGATKEIR